MDWSVIWKVLGLFLVLYIFIQVLFRIYVVTRLLAIASSGYLLYLCFTLDAAALNGKSMLFVFLTALAWLFYLGKAVFEPVPFLSIFDWDGVEWEIVADGGGFLGHAITALVVCGILYFIAPHLPALYYIAPGVILVLTVVSIFGFGPGADD